MRRGATARYVCFIMSISSQRPVTVTVSWKPMLRAVGIWPISIPCRFNELNAVSGSSSARSSRARDCGRRASRAWCVRPGQEPIGNRESMRASRASRSSRRRSRPPGSDTAAVVLRPHVVLCLPAGRLIMPLSRGRVGTELGRLQLTGRTAPHAARADLPPRRVEQIQSRPR